MSRKRSDGFDEQNAAAAAVSERITQAPQEMVDDAEACAGAHLVAFHEAISEKIDGHFTPANAAALMIKVCTDQLASTDPKLCIRLLTIVRDTIQRLEDGKSTMLQSTQLGEVLGRLSLMEIEAAEERARCRGSM